MKTLIICISVHHSNTEKIAEAMAEVLDAEVVKPNEVDVDKLQGYDLVGFGSGIYFGRHHRSLLDLVDRLSPLAKKAFIFSTSGMRNGILQWTCRGDFNRALKKRLFGRGFDIIGEFSCIGFDTFGPFKLVGGINKRRPDEKDLEKARYFAERMEDDW